MFDAVNRPPPCGSTIGMAPSGPLALGLLGLIDVTSKLAGAPVAACAKTLGRPASSRRG